MCSFFLRYLAKENGLDGASSIISAQVYFIIGFNSLISKTFSSAQIDEVVDAINDTFNKIVRPVQKKTLILNRLGRGLQDA